MKLTIKCPNCGVQNYHAECLGGDFQPKAGDIALCATCQAPYIYGGSGSGRRVLPHEVQDVNRALDAETRLVDRLAQRHAVDAVDADRRAGSCTARAARGRLPGP